MTNPPRLTPEDFDRLRALSHGELYPPDLREKYQIGSLGNFESLIADFAQPLREQNEVLRRVAEAAAYWQAIVYASPELEVIECQRALGQAQSELRKALTEYNNLLHAHQGAM
jgi:hypothetical protein